MIKHKLTEAQRLELSKRHERLKVTMMERLNDVATPLLYQNKTMDDTELSRTVSFYEAEAYAIYQDMLTVLNLIEVAYASNRTMAEEE